jgi:RNA polymerase sigma-70 factor (ECF subfamily)
MMSGPMLDPALEQELLRQVRERAGTGCERAFEAVFRALREQLFGLCVHLTRDRGEAEDALQETFLAVHRALPQFRGDSRLSTWIWRIAIRAALRVRARRGVATETLDTEPAAPAANNPAVAREQRDRLNAGLASLSADHRVVLALFAVEGLSHKEIAALLGVPEGTIWSRLHVARKQLAAALP